MIKKISEYNYIVVGAGISGLTAAKLCAEKGNKVLVIERRNHIGGNMYDYYDDNNILIHKYGPHIFHTSNDAVYEFINRFAEWKRYDLKCATKINQKFIPVPIDFLSIDILFGEEGIQIKDELIKEYSNRKSLSVIELMESCNPTIKKFGMFLFENDFKPYSEKQWGKTFTELDNSIFARVPIIVGYKDDYFGDKYQCLPEKSYKDFFENMVDDENIDIIYNVDFSSMFEIDFDNNCVKYKGVGIEQTIIYTGAVDELLKYKYERLPYRSLRFENINEAEIEDLEYPITTFPREAKYTRVTNYSKLTNKKYSEQSYVKEYPVNAEDSDAFEAYYPVLTERSLNKYEKYVTDLKNIKNIILCGRLANYKYINMDEAIKNSMDVVKNIL